MQRKRATIELLDGNALTLFAHMHTSWIASSTTKAAAAQVPGRWPDGPGHFVSILSVGRERALLYAHKRHTDAH